MKSWAFALLFVVVTIVLTSCKEDAAPAPMGDIYDGAPPALYHGDARFTMQTFKDPSEACSQAGLTWEFGTIINACTIKIGDSNVVAMPNPCLPKYRSDKYAALLCHEQAHVIGWPGNHPK